MLNSAFGEFGQMSPEMEALQRLTRAREEEMGLYNQAFSAQPPQFANPTLGTKDLIWGIPALLAALGGNGEAAGAITQGALSGKLGWNEQQNQRKQQQFGMERENLLGKAKVAGMKTQNLEQDRAYAAQRQDRAMSQKYQQDQLQRQAAEDVRQGLEGVERAYNNAKGFDQMEKIAQRWRKLDPEGAPNPEQVRNDFQTKSATMRSTGIQRWEQALKNELNEFGEAPEGRLADLEQMRQSIATEFRIDPKSLRTVPTAKTMRREKQTEMVRQFNEKLKHIKQAHRDNLGVKKANVEIARGRLQVAEYNAQTMRGALQMNQYRGALQAYNLTVKGLNSDADSAIRELDTKIAGMKARLKVNPDDADAKKKLSELKGERDFIYSTRESEIEWDEGISGWGGPSSPQQAPPQIPSVPQVPGMAPVQGMQKQIGGTIQAGGNIPVNPVNFGGPGADVAKVGSMARGIVKSVSGLFGGGGSKPDIAKLRRDAADAIKRGAPADAVRAEFKRRTGLKL